ncbi:class I SAM-dependent rRNA methyltransferase [Granulicatella seriolae]|uniref:Class I SAM-dependent rRNA methyltransferase n=1 Tax=Granulicatella seriolae TaxID=2967226 RepID=A0ABT1WQU9_9LACT|nr:class I SAM-dependent rRNA methyltransferase [Granulicatella seriolae]
METIVVRRLAAGNIKKGSPLIQELDLARPIRGNQGEQVIVSDERGNFLGKAYLGQQHKGVAWIYSKDPNQVLDKDFITELLSKAIQSRQGLFANPDTNAFRIFNGEGDGLGGVTIDWYAGYAVFSWYSQGIYLYRDDVIEAFYDLHPETLGIYEKVRFETDGALEESQHVWGQEAPEPLLIKENGVTFASYLNQGLMTGIFLDQREVRRLLLEDYSAGKTVLNTFSYTGAFSVVAALGGATQTTSVDVANRSKEKTQEQFMVNHLDPESQLIYVMDVFDYIRYAKRKQLSFDTIVLDPPSFARTKKRTFSVAKNYGELIADLASLISYKGVLIASTNAANVSDKQFDQMIQEGLSSVSRSYSYEHSLGLPKDFPSAPATPVSDYLKVRVIRLDQ